MDYFLTKQIDTHYAYAEIHGVKSRVWYYRTLYIRTGRVSRLLLGLGKMGMKNRTQGWNGTCAFEPRVLLSWISEIRLWSFLSLNICTLLGPNFVLEVYIREACCLTPVVRASSLQSSLLGVEKNTPRNWFSFPTPRLYHTSPNPYLNSSSLTLPALDDLLLSAKLWEFRYSKHGSRSWFSLRSLGQYVMLCIWDLATSGYLPLSPYTMTLGVLLFNLKNLLKANKYTFSTVSTLLLTGCKQTMFRAAWKEAC